MKAGIALGRLALGVAMVFSVTGFSASFGDGGVISSQAHVLQHEGLGARPAHDETWFGDNWASVRTFRLSAALERPLKIYIEPRTRRAPYQPQYRDYVLESLQSWSRALDGRLQFTTVHRKKDADITVSWVSSFTERAVAGVTTYRVGHADVEIRTVGVPDKDIQCNILHELGHALGISGHSNHAGDVMVASRRWRRDPAGYHPSLSERDIQAIRRLYSPLWVKGEDLYADSAQDINRTQPKTASANSSSR